MADHPDEARAPRRPRQGRTHKPGANPAPAGGAKKPSTEAQGERIAKALARAGVASRREVERLISLGKVAVNGRILDTPATLVQPGDILTVDGKVVNGPEPTRLWRYHKPAGLVTTHRDPQGRPTVFQSLPEQLPRVISVGRLDLNSEGLLLLTNDGGLSRALELPSNAWVRRYRARAFGRVTQTSLDTLKEGITIDDVDYGPIEARLDKVQVKPGQERDAPANVWITLSLSEGKNREVRRVLEALGLTVNRLIRLAYGPFALGTLEGGEVEEVGPRVIREQLAEFIDPGNLPQGDRPMMTGPMRSPKVAAARKRAAGFADQPAAPEADARPRRSRPSESAGRIQGRREGSGRERRPAASRLDEGSFERRRERPPADAGAGGDRGPPAYKQGWAKPKHAGSGKPPRAGGYKRREGEGAERPQRPARRDDRAQGSGEFRRDRPHAEGGRRAERGRDPRNDSREGDDRSGGFSRTADRPFSPKGPRKPGTGAGRPGGPRGDATRSGPPRSGPPRSGPPRSGPPRSGPPRSGPPRGGRPPRSGGKG